MLWEIDYQIRYLEEDLQFYNSSIDHLSPFLDQLRIRLYQNISFEPYQWNLILQCNLIELIIYIRYL